MIKFYKVQEFYKGKLISVNVTEKWSNDGIENAVVYCDGCPLIRVLGHSFGNYKNGLGYCISKLTIGDINKIILRDFEFVERSIDEGLGSEYFKPEKRFLNVVFGYKNVEISIGLYIDFSNREVFVFDNDILIMSCSLDDNEYRRFLLRKFDVFKEKIDISESSKKKKFNI